VRLTLRPFVKILSLLALSLLSLILIPLSVAIAQTTADSSVSSKSTDKDQTSVPMPVALTHQYNTDLKHYLPKDKVKPILVGTTEYLTLVNESISANHKGVVILIPDWQQGIVNPKAINFLANALPKQGWTTISIQPLAKPANFPSIAEKLSTQQEENKKQLDDYILPFSKLIDAVTKQAIEYPGIVLVVAQGNLGALLLQSYSDDAVEEITKPNAVILLSSFALAGEQLITASNLAFAKTLADSEIAVLDLYLKFDNNLVLNHIAQRLAYAKQEMKVYYRQRQLTNTVLGFYPEQALLTQINSWLKSIGW